ncbi:uncharacterized protein LOC144163655 [Haemaphysalis longicornis]
MSAVFQQAEWREKLKPELPKPAFGSSIGGCVSSPSRQNMLTARDHSDADENSMEGSAHWHYLWRVRNHKRWRSEPWSSSGGWSPSSHPRASRSRNSSVCGGRGSTTPSPTTTATAATWAPSSTAPPPLAAPSLHPAPPASWPPPVTFRPRPRRGQLLPTAWVASRCCGRRVARARGWGIVCSYLRMRAPLAEGWTGPESLELPRCTEDTGATSSSAQALAPSQGMLPSTRSRQVLRMAPAAQDCAAASQG